MTGVFSLPEEGRVSGETSISAFPRLFHHMGDQSGLLAYELEVQSLDLGLQPQKRVSGTVTLSSQMHCERCQKPYDFKLTHSFRWLFLKEGDVPAVAEEGMEIFETPLDVDDIFEDEVILGLPLIYDHEQCECFLPYRVRSEEQHPFNVLASLIN